MPEHHTRQNTFAGHTGRHPSTVPKGGAKQDLPVLSGEGCWCGEEYGHDWPGKSIGKPHPREEGSNMNAEPSKMVTRTVAAKDLRGWNKDVVRLVKRLVQDHGVQYRSTGRGGILLYPPDGGRPFRISAKRPPQDTVKFLSAFAEECVPGWNAVTEEDAVRLAEALNSDEHPITPPKTRKAAQPRPTPPSPAVFTPPTAPKAEEVMEIPPTATPVIPTTIPTSDQWVQFLNERGEYTGWSTRLVDGQQVFLCDRCREEGKERIVTHPAGMGGHGRMHGPTGADAQRKWNAKVRTAAEDAALSLLDALGIDLGSDSEKDEEIALLRKELTKMTAERDELQKRLDKARAAFGL